MTAALEPGSDGAAVPRSERVFRLAKATSDGKLTPESFVLSTEDRKHAPPRVSVWVEALTSLEQAHSLTGGHFGLAGFLSVAAVESLRPNPDDPVVRGLRVEWERAANADAPGARGHAGIAGLDQDGHDSAGKRLDRYRKSFRAALARLANETRVVPLPPST